MIGLRFSLIIAVASAMTFKFPLGKPSPPKPPHNFLPQRALQQNRLLHEQDQFDIPGIQRSNAFDEDDSVARMNVRSPFGNHLAENDNAFPEIRRSYAFDEDDAPLPRMHQRPRSNAFDEQDAPPPMIHQRPRSNAFDEQVAPPRIHQRPRSNAFDGAEFRQNDDSIPEIRRSYAFDEEDAYASINGRSSAPNLYQASRESQNSFRQIRRSDSFDQPDARDPFVAARRRSANRHNPPDAALPPLQLPPPAIPLNRNAPVRHQLRGNINAARNAEQRFDLPRPHPIRAEQRNQHYVYQREGANNVGRNLAPEFNRAAEGGLALPRPPLLRAENRHRPYRYRIRRNDFAFRNLNRHFDRAAEQVQRAPPPLIRQEPRRAQLRGNDNENVVRNLNQEFNVAQFNGAIVTP